MVFTPYFSRLGNIAMLPSNCITTATATAPPEEKLAISIRINTPCNGVLTDKADRLATVLFSPSSRFVYYFITHYKPFLYAALVG
jgi:exoribonuclease II